MHGLRRGPAAGGRARRGGPAAGPPLVEARPCRVRLLGTAAGGGFPQWNCACGNCRAARGDPAAARPRTQASAAVSGDGRRWFLLNASPDLRAQVEAFPALLPPEGAARGTGIAGVLLTAADLDCALGLFLLREGGRVAVHATAAVRRALDDGLRLTAVLDRYGGVEWREPPREPAPLAAADGAERADLPRLPRGRQAARATGGTRPPRRPATASATASRTGGPAGGWSTCPAWPPWTTRPSPSAAPPTCC